MKRLLALFVLVVTLSFADVPAKGVEFFYLNGVSQDLYYVLDRLNDPLVSAQLNNVLDGYKDAHVTFVRLLIASNHDPNNSYPLPFTARVAEFNDLIHRISSRGMRLELLFVGATNNAGFADPPPYVKDKQWVTAYMDGLDRSAVDLVVLGGDTALCGAVADHLSCYPDADTPQPWANMGQWIVQMTAWAKQAYPKVSFSNETWLGWGDPDGPSGEISRRVSKFFDEQTPGAPYTTGPEYLTLPDGSTWQDFASLFSRTIYRFHSLSNRPLWIDEYGAGFADVNRSAYLRGVLTATGCAPAGYVGGESLWEAGNDGGGGFVTFDGATAIWDKDWATIATFYNAPQCTPPIVSGGGVAITTGTYPVWLSGTGFTKNTSIELYDADGSLWGVNIVPLVVDPNFLTFSLPANKAPSGCNVGTPCFVPVVVVSDGSPSKSFDIILPPQQVPRAPQATIAIAAAGVTYSFTPPAVWVVQTGTTPTSRVIAGGNSISFILTPSGAMSFTLPFCGNTYCTSFYIVNDAGTPSNVFTLSLGATH